MGQSELLLGTCWWTHWYQKNSKNPTPPTFPKRGEKKRCLGCLLAYLSIKIDNPTCFFVGSTHREETTHLCRIRDKILSCSLTNVKMTCDCRILFLDGCNIFHVWLDVTFSNTTLLGSCTSSYGDRHGPTHEFLHIFLHELFQESCMWDIRWD
jgi:hypothetical protein